MNWKSSIPPSWTYLVLVFVISYGYLILLWARPCWICISKKFPDDGVSAAGLRTTLREPLICWMEAHLGALYTVQPGSVRYGKRLIEGHGDIF